MVQVVVFAHRRRCVVFFERRSFFRFRGVLDKFIMQDIVLLNPLVLCLFFVLHCAAMLGIFLVCKK